MSLWMEPIPQGLQLKARGAIAAGDVLGFLGFASNEYGIDLVMHNRPILQAKGIYETALVQAVTRPRVNNLRYTLGDLRLLLQLADRARLVKAGDPIPEKRQFTLYRGVAGRGRNRRIRGISWTDDLSKAHWFAKRFANILGNSAVYCAAVPRSAVYVYTNGRNEREYIVVLPKTVKPSLIQTEVDR